MVLGNTLWYRAWPTDYFISSRGYAHVSSTVPIFQQSAGDNRYLAEPHCLWSSCSIGLYVLTKRTLQMKESVYQVRKCLFML
jgi:hypothetical protein